MKQRIDLAAVYAMKPGLAVLDKIYPGLDILTLDNIAEMIKSFKGRGTTVLLITHMEEIAKIADRTPLMCSGAWYRRHSFPGERVFQEELRSLPRENIPRWSG